MTDQRAKRLCPTCGRLGRCDDHHALAEAHAPDVMTPACTVSCHPVLTERQMISGIVRDHDVDRGDAEDGWAFLSGIGDLLYLMALSVPVLGVQEAELEERMTISLGRVLYLQFRSASEKGIEGPNPRANDLRVAGRRHFRQADRSKPLRPPPPFNEATVLERAKLLSLTLAQAQDTLPDRLVASRVRAAGREFAATQDAGFAGLGMLADRGRDEDIMACVHEGLRRRMVVNALLEKAESVADVERARPALAAYDEFRERYFEFMRGMVQANDADEAERALGRLMASVLPG